MKNINVLSRQLDQVKNNWQFSEVWVDTNLFPPSLLLLLSDASGKCIVCDPTQEYKIIFGCISYQEAENWLREDQYQLMSGRLSI